MKTIIEKIRCLRSELNFLSSGTMKALVLVFITFVNWIYSAVSFTSYLNLLS